mmetsp:Transcript_100984/g.261008  ORF Transcript_100984/g.261008 Transcript_100984/m.261008 type:complete len:94 (+) Transcript_100984:2-283(+)
MRRLRVGEPLVSAGQADSKLYQHWCECEARCLAELRYIFGKLLEAYPTSLQEDEKVSQEGNWSGPKAMALALRISEKRILSAARVAVEVLLDS